MPSIPVQGSGTYAVEAVIQSTTPKDGGRYAELNHSPVEGQIVSGIEEQLEERSKGVVIVSNPFPIFS
jgi:hypothetical protein